jgi:hypothetical protein
MATSGASEGGFSGKAGFVLRYEISRTSAPAGGTSAVWHVELHAINRSGYLSYDLSGRPFSVTTAGFTASGSWVPDFRAGSDLLIYAADRTIGTDGDGYSAFSWSASAGPAGLFGSAGTSGSLTANRIPQAPSTPDAPVLRTDATQATTLTWGYPEPDDAGGSTITSYQAQLSYNSGFTNIRGTRDFDPANRGTQKFTGLDNNTTYYMRHRVLNGVGYSGWSTYSSGTTNVGVPSVPRNLATSNIGPSTATLTWDHHGLPCPAGPEQHVHLGPDRVHYD